MINLYSSSANSGLLKDLGPHRSVSTGQPVNSGLVYQFKEEFEPIIYQGFYNEDLFRSPKGQEGQEE